MSFYERFDENALKEVGENYLRGGIHLRWQGRREKMRSTSVHEIPMHIPNGGWSAFDWVHQDRSTRLAAYCYRERDDELVQVIE